MKTQDILLTIGGIILAGALIKQYQRNRIINQYANGEAMVGMEGYGQRYARYFSGDGHFTPGCTQLAAQVSGCSNPPPPVVAGLPVRWTLHPTPNNKCEKSYWSLQYPSWGI